ncbi:MAG: metallophosphoesterase [Lachnospiraceae bacterium]|nr:metallophosphoesterase [Lachnospiraceae bacterium]
MKYILIIGCVLLLILLGIYVYRESTLLSITEYILTSDKLKVPEYRIAMLSDLHEKSHGRDNEEVMKRIDELHPDAVMFAGDMITFSKTHPFDYGVSVSLAERIAARYPLYYGIGNHEEKLKRPPGSYMRQWEYYTGELKKRGIRIMQNEAVEIPEAGITVYGLDLEHLYFRRVRDYPIPDGYLNEKLGAVDPENYSILLAHLPDQFAAYAKWGADLVLSGHVHGGVIRLPFFGGLVSPQLKLFPHYDAGRFEEGSSVMILSRGIGTHSVPIRINNRAEIVHIIIRSEKTK